LGGEVNFEAKGEERGVIKVGPLKDHTTERRKSMQTSFPAGSRSEPKSRGGIKCSGGG